jgi:Glycosyl hydrolases family 18
MKKGFALIGSLVLVITLSIFFATNTYRQQQDLRSKAAGSYISVIFYPGWNQSSIPPNSLDYSAWTHIMHFGFHPTTSGGIELGDMSNSSYPAAAISAAHGANRKILYTVGGAGTGDAFKGAVQSQNMDKFVTAIVNNMKQYGYDGIDIDWEEDVNEAQLVTLMQKLRTEVDKINPRPLLTIDVDGDLTPPSMIAKLDEYADYIHVMSYWDGSTAMVDKFANAGIPYNKMTFGMGFNDGGYDTTAARVQTKVDYAKSKGMAGVMVWSIEGVDSTKTAPIKALIAGNTTNPTVAPTVKVPTVTPTKKPSTPTATTKPGASPTLIVNPTTGPTTSDKATYLKLNLFLHGLGKAGDSINPSAAIAATPKNTQRTVTVAFYKQDNTLVLSHDGTVSYEPSLGSFAGIVNMGSLKSLPAGQYILRIKVSKYLPYDIQTQVNIPENGGSYTVPTVSLIAGDIRNDNTLDILDYTDLLKCYSDLSASTGCSDTEKQLADITDDGSANQIDYNLLLREFSGAHK